jgi:hypothetical protein
MPDIGIGEIQMSDNVSVIKHAASASGWRPVEGEPQDGDILLCRDLIGKRHVGVMIEDRGRLLLLHNDGHITAKGPVGSVIAQTLRDARSGGITDIELWRRA